MRLKWAVLATSIVAVGLVAFLIALTGLAETAGSPVDDSTSASPSEEALRHAIDVRQRLGLQSDDSSVRSTFDLPLRPSMSVDIPITDAEEHFIGRQDAVAGSVAATEPSFKPEPGFGGAWFDYPNSRIMVAVTDDAGNDLVPRFAARVP